MVPRACPWGSTGVTDNELFAFLSHQPAIDGFIIETMFDLQEALCTLRACKESADLPVVTSIASNTSEHRGRTIMGSSAQDCAQALTVAGACLWRL